MHARPDRRRDIAHVGPIELRTPVLEESRDSAELAGFDDHTIDRLADGTHKRARRRADEMTAATDQLRDLGVTPRIADVTRDLLCALRDQES